MHGNEMENEWMKVRDHWNGANKTWKMEYHWSWEELDNQKDHKIKDNWML